MKLNSLLLVQSVSTSHNWQQWHHLVHQRLFNKHLIFSVVYMTWMKSILGPSAISGISGYALSVNGCNVFSAGFAAHWSGLLFTIYWLSIKIFHPLILHSLLVRKASTSTSSTSWRASTCIGSIHLARSCSPLVVREPAPTGTTTLVYGSSSTVHLLFAAAHTSMEETFQDY